MEKISNIVGGSKRATTKDVLPASAVRPGAPSFGRPMGSSTVGPPSRLTTAERAMAEHQRMVDKRAESQANMVQQLAGRFFMQSPPESLSIPAPALLPEPPTSELKPKIEAEVNDPRTELEAPAADDYIPPGTLLNVSA